MIEICTDRNKMFLIMIIVILLFMLVAFTLNKS
jgi:hypothetical protein